MHRKHVPTNILTFVAVLGALAVPQVALAWGSATHFHFGKRLGHLLGYANVQEMYGAALPDVPTLMFSNPQQQAFYEQTHFEYLTFVSQARSLLSYKKAMAFGFASHNGDWGADATAHKHAITLRGPNDGYVNEKVKQLEPLLRDLLKQFLKANGKTEAEAETLALLLAPVLADTCIEAAVDFLVSENEFKAVGIEMILAAETRDAFAPTMLASAYSSDVLPAPVIIAAEALNREYIKTYGGVLALPSWSRLDALSQAIATLATNVLNAPPYNLLFTVPTPLIRDSLDLAILYVKHDYSKELAATLAEVGRQLRLHGIWTSLMP